MSKPTAGPCIWCGEYVTDQRQESGCKTPDWAAGDGDFGCGMSPDTTPVEDEDGGTGSHARPSDPILRNAGAMYEVLDRINSGAIEYHDWEAIRELLAEIDGE